MNGSHTIPYNPPGVEGDEASMLEHVFQMTGRRLNPEMVWPQKPPFTAQWKPFPMKPWQKAPRGKSSQGHKSFG